MPQCICWLTVSSARKKVFFGFSCRDFCKTPNALLHIKRMHDGKRTFAEAFAEVASAGLIGFGNGSGKAMHEDATS